MTPSTWMTSTSGADAADAADADALTEYESHSSNPARADRNVKRGTIRDFLMSQALGTAFPYRPRGLE